MYSDSFRSSDAASRIRSISRDSGIHTVTRDVFFSAISSRLSVKHAESRYERIRCAGSRVIRFAKLDLVKCAKRNPRKISKPLKLGEGVVFDRALDVSNRIHGEKIPFTGNKGNRSLIISAGDNLPYDARMDTTAFRRRNLRTIIDDRYEGKLARFAEAYDMPRPNITQLIKGPRAFGSELARRIEEKEGLRLGWMDEEVPLSDQALRIARAVMSLTDNNHRAEVESVAMALCAVERHNRDAMGLGSNRNPAGNGV